MGQFEKTLMWMGGWNTAIVRHETEEHWRVSGLQYVPGYWRTWHTAGFRGALILTVLASQSSRSANVILRVLFCAKLMKWIPKGEDRPQACCLYYLIIDLDLVSGACSTYGKERTVKKVLEGKHTRKGQLVDLRVGYIGLGSTLILWITMGGSSINLALNGDKWRAVVNKVMNIP